MGKGVKKMINIVAGILLFLVVIISVLTIYLVVISKGKPMNFLDENGNVIPNSISEKVVLKINGRDEGMFICGESTDNPVILFIHGGPGVPEYFLNEYYQTGLEKYFTLCWWEYPGSGMSYSFDLNPEEITTEQIVDDAAVVSKYLSERFKKEKVYLMAHSGGSYIGIQVAKKYPELYHAYIGMAQSVYYPLGTWEANTLTYNYISEVFKKQDDSASLKKLNKYSIKSSDGKVIFNQDYLNALDDLKHKTGCGTMYDMNSVITGIFLPQMNSRCYTLSEKINYWRGKAFMNGTTLYQEFQEMDFRESITKLEIPVYFFSGIYDYTCPYPLSQEYLEMIDAPKKAFYLFDQSAHSPLWEEPEKAVKILVEDVLD